jgi:hypothetical protein
MNKIYSLLFVLITTYSHAQSWNQVNKIIANDRNTGDFFGNQVAINGDYAIVNARGEDEDEVGGNTLNGAGAAYIFKKNGTNWAQEAKIVALDRAVGDAFSYAVAIYGDYAVIGAPYEDDDINNSNPLADAGSVYIFKRDGVNWIQEAKLVANDRGIGDLFGISVSIFGDYVVVGSLLDDENELGTNTALNSGSAYIFKRNGTSWSQEAKIVANDRVAGPRFGTSVSISGDYVIVGAFLENRDAAGLNSLGSAGAAYIFKRNGTNWVQEAKIVASDRANSDSFGNSVSISGDYIAVGAWGNDFDGLGIGSNLALNAGAAYIFKRNAASWVQEKKIVASDRAASDFFGRSIAISGDLVIVGAYLEDEDATSSNTLSNAGSVYIYKRTLTNWTQSTKIVASDRAIDDSFGFGLAIDGNTIIAGSSGNDKDITGNNFLTDAGSAYVFTNPTALPVELMNFTVVQNDQFNYLSWQTSNEQNSDYFDIERSTDAKQFDKIGTIKAFGTTNQVQNYHFLDTLLPPQYKVLYYRLRQVDTDNKVNYSPIRSIKIDKQDKHVIKIYPNPNNGQFIATIPISENATEMMIQNSRGEVIWKGRVEAGQESQSIQLDQAANGLYFVSCRNNQGLIKNIKFVINR